MPRVGKKHYPYTEEGYEQAAAQADKTGSTIINGYAGGGSIDHLLEDGARTVSDADRQRVADEYDVASKAANRDYTYDRSSYIQDLSGGRTLSDADRNRRKTVSDADRKRNKRSKPVFLKDGGPVYGKETIVKQPESAGGESTMRGMGAATKGGKFSGVF